jgi:hypothetical protein
MNIPQLPNTLTWMQAATDTEDRDALAAMLLNHQLSFQVCIGDDSSAAMTLLPAMSRL